MSVLQTVNHNSIEELYEAFEKSIDLELHLLMSCLG